MSRIWLGRAALCLSFGLALGGCVDGSAPDAPTQTAAVAGNSGASGGTSVAGGGTGGAGPDQAEGGESTSITAGGTAGSEPVGAGGEGGDPNSGDPCKGVTAQGECATPQQARVCIVPTGNGSPSLVTTNCRSFEHCDDTRGAARCVLDDDACVPQQAECVDAKNLRTCDDQGTWQQQACPGLCRPSAIGGFCVKDSPTTAFAGKLTYEATPVLDDFSDWSPTSFYIPGDGVLVLSGDGTDWLDAAVVDENGAFNLQVPTTTTGTEKLAFFLEHRDPTGAYTELAVFQPDLPDGVAQTNGQRDGQAWSWSIPLDHVSPGENIQISEPQGSGAMHVFRRLLSIQRYVAQFYNAEPGTLVAWVRPNTTWDCGTCFAPWSIEVGSTQFESQLFMPASAKDQSYWSDAVIAHEAGHYVMWSYGVSPNEGGQHCLGNTTAPGQAWSEGWATGFSTIFRGSPMYWDKQQGSMFWFNLEQRKYDGYVWKRPSPQLGLLQDIDENEVAAMLYSLAGDERVGKSTTLLGLGRPNVMGRKFRRGYTRRVWDIQNCKRVNTSDTGESSPMLADFLDGLVCNRAPTDAIDATTNPSVAYPYPSKAPLCP